MVDMTVFGRSSSARENELIWTWSAGPRPTFSIAEKTILSGPDGSFESWLLCHPASTNSGRAECRKLCCSVRHKRTVVIAANVAAIADQSAAETLRY